MTNIETNASAKHIGVVNRSEPPHTVPNQLNVLIADGTAINMVENEKADDNIRFIPLTNMWCPHTTKPRIPIEAIA
jgi:hypothetical protein